MARKKQQWEINMIIDDYNFYTKEKHLARNSISITDSISDQKRKFSAIIYGDYWRAFFYHMKNNKKIPEYNEYQKHWLFANKELWQEYEVIEKMCNENIIGHIQKPMINKGYTQVGAMWGLN